MSEIEFKADFPSETIQEGKVRLVVPKLEAFKKQPADYAPSKAPVFYNPVMEMNRDISVLSKSCRQGSFNLRPVNRVRNQRPPLRN
jgi:tRNA G26 N,N-dimethylase Trm1